MFHYTGIASFLILLWIINSKNIKKGLDNSVLRFLGKISYGVYLMHWLLVVYVMEHWVQLISNFGNWYVGFGVLLTAVVVGTLILATLVYYLVEEPFIKLSKVFLVSI